MTWDILIRGGCLIDGSGSPGTLADIAVAAGRIAAINSSLSGKASKVINAEGLAVAPGFIDIKTHSDLVLPIREIGFPEYLDTFPAVAVNTGMLVGHNTLRLMVMGLEDRAPTKAELDQMIV